MLWGRVAAAGESLIAHRSLIVDAVGVSAGTNPARAISTAHRPEHGCGARSVPVTSGPTETAQTHVFEKPAFTMDFYA